MPQLLLALRAIVELASRSESLENDDGDVEFHDTSGLALVPLHSINAGESHYIDTYGLLN